MRKFRDHPVAFVWLLYLSLLAVVGNIAYDFDWPYGHGYLIVEYWPYCLAIGYILTVLAEFYKDRWRSRDEALLHAIFGDWRID